MADDFAHSFGQHIRSLRRARGQTQEKLAARSGLSEDTIRRLERGGFSPSLDTLRKVCRAFDIRLSTLFEAFEVGEVDPRREIMDLLLTVSEADVARATRVMRALIQK